MRGKHYLDVLLGIMATALLGLENGIGVVITTGITTSEKKYFSIQDKPLIYGLHKLYLFIYIRWQGCRKKELLADILH